MISKKGIAIEVVNGCTSEKEYDLIAPEYKTCAQCKRDGSCQCAGSASTCRYGVSAFARPTLCRLS